MSEVLTRSLITGLSTRLPASACLLVFGGDDAAGLRLRDAGRDRLGYLLVDLHRLAGADRLEGARARLPRAAASGSRSRWARCPPFPEENVIRAARGRRAAPSEAEAPEPEAPEPSSRPSRAGRRRPRRSRRPRRRRGRRSQADDPAPSRPRAPPSPRDADDGDGEDGEAGRRRAGAERGERRRAASAGASSEAARQRRRRRKHGRQPLMAAARLVHDRHRALALHRLRPGPLLAAGSSAPSSAPSTGAMVTGADRPDRARQRHRRHRPRDRALRGSRAPLLGLALIYAIGMRARASALRARSVRARQARVPSRRRT